MWKFSRPSIKSAFPLIEPEEVLPDAHNLAGFSVERLEGKMEVALNRLVLVIAVSLFIGGLLVFEARLAYLALVKGKEYFSAAEENRIDLVVSPAPRGLILDWRGKEIASSRPGFSIIIAKDFLPSEPKERQRVVSLMAQLAAITQEEITAALEASRDIYVLIENDIDRDIALVLKNRADELPGVIVEERSIRSYLWPKEFSHIIGYVGKPSKEDFASFAGLSSVELVGKSGLERFYEEELGGISGQKLIEVDAGGRPRHQVLTRKSKPGNQLVLEIDTELQKKLFDVLERTQKGSGASGASAVVLDYETGAIRAAVSVPSFDVTLFGKRDAFKEIQQILTSESKPLFNRAFLGLYPPGSSIKPFLASAALEEHIISPQTKIHAPLAIFIKNDYNPDIIYKFSDWRDHGYLDLAGAIAWSSNVYFYTIGGGYNGIKGLGISRINQWLRKFGFGARLLEEALAEGEGFLPTPEWKKKAKNEPWTLGDTFNVSIGQGDILVTPLQMAAATAALANGGTLYAPRLVREIRSPDGKLIEEKKPKVLRSGLVRLESLKVVREGMRKAAQEGTISTFFTFPYPIYGKTGSAQAGPTSKIYSWFTGYVDIPEIPLAITVMVEGGIGGDRTAAPVARETLEWYLGEVKVASQ